MVSSIASQHEVARSYFLCCFPLWDLCGHTSFLPQSTHMNIRLTSDSKMGASVKFCLYLCVSPAANWWSVQGVPCVSLLK